MRTPALHSIVSRSTLQKFFTPFACSRESSGAAWCLIFRSAMELDFIDESSEDKREHITTELTGWEQIVFEIGDEEAGETSA